MKIAFCFLTYDIIVRYDLWNKFFENIDQEKYSIFIHPKNIGKSSNSKYSFQYNIVKNRVNTTSKDNISIVYATLQLLKEAYYSDQKITHFIFLSQSCIPLYSFNTIYEVVTKFPNSVLSYIDKNRKERYFQLSPQLKQIIKYNNFVKQQPNMILTREDLMFLLVNNYTNHFVNMTCPDEHYFINVLLHILKRKIIKKQIHFCNFDLTRTQALEFNSINKNLIDNIRNLGFLFMRKASSNSYIDMDYIIINQ
jgi:hypothetical protein